MVVLFDGRMDDTGTSPKVVAIVVCSPSGLLPYPNIQTRELMKYVYVPLSLNYKVKKYIINQICKYLIHLKVIIPFSISFHQHNSSLNIVKFIKFEIILDSVLY